MGADRLPAVPFSIFSITAKYEFVKPPAGAVFILAPERSHISSSILQHVFVSHSQHSEYFLC